MSSSRSVAAAQRRRVGPPEPQQPSRGPNTSIQSSQAFTQQQIQPGTSGRLAGQHAALQQQQQQQQRKLQSNQNAAGTSKMTIPQAITLITLRLGRVENQLQNLDDSPTVEVDEEGNIIPNSNASSIDDNLLSNILERLDSLEKIILDVASLKQQIDLFKPTLIKNTSSTNVLMKDVKEIKTSTESIKNDFKLTQSLVKDLQLLVNPPNLEEEEEFVKIYNLEVMVIPTNRPMIRIDKPDLLFKNEL